MNTDPSKRGLSRPIIDWREDNGYELTLLRTGNRLRKQEGAERGQERGYSKETLLVQMAALLKKV